MGVRGDENGGEGNGDAQPCNLDLGHPKPLKPGEINGPGAVSACSNPPTWQSFFFWSAEYQGPSCNSFHNLQEMHFALTLRVKVLGCSGPRVDFTSGLHPFGRRFWVRGPFLPDTSSQPHFKLFWTHSQSDRVRRPTPNRPHFDPKPTRIRHPDLKST